MNKVAQRCGKEGCAKFLYASNRMYSELKVIKIVLYLLNIVPVLICFLPQTNQTGKLICSLISFLLTLINECSSQFVSNYKEKAILEHQLYESEITGSTFSKIEYDRESTNELHELAIRKGLPKMKNVGKYPVSMVPQDITDDYSYLYLCRKSAASYRYLLSRMFYFYFAILISIAVGFVFTTVTTTETSESIYYIICFWPLIIPFIRDCSACKKCCKQCVKISADIDNFFADGDDSIERLARFYFYVQNIEFEMLTVRPVIFNFFKKMFNRGVIVLTDGVTTRFKEAVVELKSKKYIQKGVISQPRGKNLITKMDIDLDELKRKEKLLKERAKKRTKVESVEATFVDAEIIEPTPIYKESTPRRAKLQELTTSTTKEVVRKPRTSTTATKIAAPKATSAKATTKPKTSTQAKAASSNTTTRKRTTTSK